MATLRVSVTLIKRIKITEISGAAENLLQAVYVLNQTVFTGTKPFTQVAFQAIIDYFTSNRTLFLLNGFSAKLNYTKGFKALKAAILLHAPYVDGIAEGDAIILKLSTLPITGAKNDSGTQIQNGAIPLLVKGNAGGTGLLTTTCAPFGTNVHFTAILVHGQELPAGTIMDLNGQLLFPSGSTAPAYIINVNGKREKKYINLIPGVIYYVYYVMSFGGIVSALSAPFKVSSGA